MIPLLMHRDAALAESPMSKQPLGEYRPSHGLMSLRYSMAGWEGDLDISPQPLMPYADYK